MRASTQSGVGFGEANSDVMFREQADESDAFLTTISSGSPIVATSLLRMSASTSVQNVEISWSLDAVQRSTAAEAGFTLPLTRALRKPLYLTLARSLFVAWKRTASKRRREPAIPRSCWTLRFKPVCAPHERPGHLTAPDQIARTGFCLFADGVCPDTNFAQRLCQSLVCAYLIF